MNGKVIAFVAPSRSGKTFLTKKLSRHFSCPALYESDVPIPEKIRYVPGTPVNYLERHLYFRGRAVDMQQNSRAFTAQSAYTFLDAAWVNCGPYIDIYPIDEFERTLLKQLFGLDMRTLPWPDALIILSEDDATSENLLKQSGPEAFDTDYFQNHLLAVKRSFEKFIDTTTFPVPTVHIDRSGIDFNDEQAFARLLEQIKPVL